MRITAKQTHDISQDIQTGMKVFINRENLETKSILDWDDFGDTELWEEELEKIEKVLLQILKQKLRHLHTDRNGLTFGTRNMEII